MSEQTKEQAASLPRIGDPAPQFAVNTTHGPIKLEDYKGSWLVLFSHPADFTPVCTTEFVAFQEIYPQLKELNTELLGLSVDSVQSHIAWVRNIQEKLGVKVEFPVIADLNKEVATKYGMIHPGESTTETNRAVFVIDDNQIIKAIIYYPLTTGRNMDEIVRLVKALQTTANHQVSTPANWKPGEKVVVPPPSSQQQAEERANDEELEVIDWYLAKKELKE
ncbi:peroxiredoxin (alkyl hydroperoxide reductase subunit C) [Melghiribacillus thermohalophilus]|uniref:Peroxiredoxin n=1 Tax=Melghiribacillus thermohalophilus TaxID=1324956 RepID=A0A4R3MXJ7_9BACI|nr:peroxiredoxin [Melghiribacillus thermohalophilus]TCT20507.1 peroxiredoxin (alkyl hydroperoxide reductase subunit C) [Melghiribacillus thermohalophilus]